MDRPLVIAVFLVFVTSLLSAYFLVGVYWPGSSTGSVMEFEENDLMVVQINELGESAVEVDLTLPPSPFADFLKYVILMEGVSSYTLDYAESVRSSFARYGLEADNIGINLTLGPGLNLKASWELRGLTRWTENGWEVVSQWPDPQSAAEEFIAEQEIAKVMMRSVARQNGYDEAHFWQYYETRILLPPGAENISLGSAGGTERVDYGGGSYTEGVVEQTVLEGSPALVESGRMFITTEGEFTITPENLAENNVSFVARYSAPAPLGWSFADAVDRARLDLKYGLELSENYPVPEEREVRWLSPAQLLFNAARVVLAENIGVDLDLREVSVVGEENGDWTAVWEELTRSDFLDLAGEVVDRVSTTGEVPASFQTEFGRVRFCDVLYLMLRLVREIGEGENLPENVLLAPSPSGILNWGGLEIPAEYSYFLLPDRYVWTNTERVGEVLGSLPENLDNRGLVEEICNWVGSNLKYGLSFKPPTSEEVLENGFGQCRDFSNVFLALVRSAGLPARRVTGWVVSDWTPPAGWGFTSTQSSSGETVALHSWVEVLVPGEGWIPVEPQSQRPDLYVGVLPYESYREQRQSWMSALAGFESAGGVL